MQRVFVYGTLRPGGAAEEKMRGCQWCGSATVRGSLFQIQWYPGLVLDDSGKVAGDLFEVPDEKMEALDAYEACRTEDPEPHEYRRVKVIARDSDGGESEVWVWEYILPVQPEARIVDGDWIVFQVNSKRA